MQSAPVNDLTMSGIAQTRLRLLLQSSLVYSALWNSTLDTTIYFHEQALHEMSTHHASSHPMISTLQLCCHDQTNVPQTLRQNADEK